MLLLLLLPSSLLLLLALFIIIIPYDVVAFSVGANGAADADGSDGMSKANGITVVAAVDNGKADDAGVIKIEI